MTGPADDADSLGRLLGKAVLWKTQRGRVTEVLDNAIGLQSQVLLKCGWTSRPQQTLGNFLPRNQHASWGKTGRPSWLDLTKIVRSAMQIFFDA